MKSLKIYKILKKSAFKFSTFKEPNLSPFEKLFNIFKELIIHTSGDFDEAIDWLRELDKEYKLTDEDFIKSFSSKLSYGTKADIAGSQAGAGKFNFQLSRSQAIGDEEGDEEGGAGAEHFGDEEKM